MQNVSVPWKIYLRSSVCICTSPYTARWKLYDGSATVCLLSYHQPLSANAVILIWQAVCQARYQPQQKGLGCNMLMRQREHNPSYRGIDVIENVLSSIHLWCERPDLVMLPLPSLRVLCLQFMSSLRRMDRMHTQHYDLQYFEFCFCCCTLVDFYGKDMRINTKHWSVVHGQSVHFLLISWVTEPQTRVFVSSKCTGAICVVLLLRSAPCWQFCNWTCIHGFHFVRVLRVTSTCSWNIEKGFV